MEVSSSLMWYMAEERRREKNRLRNQNIMDRQLFQRAEQMGIISILPEGVSVLDTDRAVHHFSHHPNLVDMCPTLGWALNGDVARLEPALTSVWEQVSAFRG